MRFRHTNSFQDSFYRPLTPDQIAAAHRNEYDFDSPDAIDFDVLVERLRDIKEGYVLFFFSFYLTLYPPLLTVLPQKKGRDSCLLLREAFSSGQDYNNLLSSRAHPGRHLRSP